MAEFELSDVASFESVTIDDGGKVVVGDDKQPEFYPQVKIEKWENESNFSIRLAESIDGASHKVVDDGKKIVWTKGQVEANFYEKTRQAAAVGTQIRIIREDTISPARIAAEYEIDRHFSWPQQTIRVHRSSERALMYYGFYPADEFIDLPLVDVPECRLSSAPSWNDPMIMDEGLWLICVHYNGERDDLNLLHNVMRDSVASVLANYDVEVDSQGSNGKLYYRNNNNEWVKFFSTAFVGGYYYFYVNLDCDYNSAYDYYHEGMRTPRADLLANGLRNANPNIPDTVIDEILEVYAAGYGLPLSEEPFTPEEEQKLSQLEAIHSHIEWIRNAQRTDVYQLFADETNEDAFEFDITLLEPPASNEIDFTIQTKDLDFYFQGPIEGDPKLNVRPPRVVGSYAVYHSTAQNGAYGTGKAFHIYRPIIIDAAGERVWGDLEIDVDNETAKITVPEQFLATAQYPVVVDPTFGYTTVGASKVQVANTGGSTTVHALQTTTTEIGVITKLTANLAAPLGGCTGEMNIYSSGTRQGDAAGSSNLALSGAAAWRDFPISLYFAASASFSLAVWGVTATGGAGYDVIELAYDTQTSAGATAPSTYSADNWPSSLTFTGNNNRYSIYATYANRLDSSAIASGEAFGTATLLAQVAPTAIASGEAFGTATLRAQVTPSGISSAEAFGTAVLSPGGVTVTPSAIASAEAFGSATIKMFLLPSAIASAEAFGSPTFVPGSVILLPSGIASAEVFGTAQLNAVIFPSGVASAEAFGTANFAQGVLTIQPSSIASQEAFGSPSFVPGAVTLLVSSIASGEAFGTATFVPGPVVLLPAGIVSAEAFGSHTILAGAVAVLPSGIASGEAFGTPALVVGTAAISPSSIASQEQFGVATLLPGVVVIYPTGLASAEAFGQPTFSTLSSATEPIETVLAKLGLQVYGRVPGSPSAQNSAFIVRGGRVH